MLRRMLILFVLSILFVAMSGPVLADQSLEIQPIKTTWDPPTEIDMPEADNEGLGFGKKIAGAWLGTGWFAFDWECDGIASTDPIPFAYDSQSFTASGLYIVTNPSDPNLAHGTWKKTGRREITTNNIVYFNSAETEMPELEFVMRIPGVFTFDEGFTTATSTFHGIGYFAAQDPLDPTEVPLWCTIGQHTVLRKVSVTP